MKTALIILSLFFLVLWIAGCFYATRSSGIHAALIVSLIFFIKSIIYIKNPEAKHIRAD
jgi:hypothetical protein